ncbi:TPA: hypothetical protein PWU90_001112 [Mannheimia haemolytica]|uniref:hypothetical protein n=1 Tax=Mannheimia haemolytica TaxID=75985 RepID=UPI00077E9DAF|nr:hypothetical protein [Mannheimia haemolytica]KYL08424.1 hypothetical protein AC568_06915 [Mannheimia haemolytica]UFK43687.1 hypothetical protein LO774_05720 [Mannheimia haemolytica]HDL1112859.1 hypothetical protein [Mannheimia haemolytica]HDL1115300.1 hypothetical protein [Mannheimia haemolytica]HDL1123460.1 hypothetical protein [Mannheimia haemolytica]
MKKYLFFAFMTLSNVAYSNLDEWYSASDKERREFIAKHFAEETVRSDRNTPYDYAMCTGRMFAKQLTRDEVKGYPLANTKPQYLTRDRRIEIMSNLPREILQNCAKYIQ